MYKKVFLLIFAGIFTASIISSCNKGEDGKDGADGANGADGTNGKPGSVVTIGDNCNWWIDGVDTGKPACAEPGEPGTQGSVVYIGDNGNWWIDDMDTDISATGPQGPKGDPGSVVSIGSNGNWFIDNVDQNIKAAGSEITIGPNGNWWIDGDDTGYKATDIIMANFTADKLEVDAGETITFTDQTNTSPESWEWTFTHESGTPELKSTDQNPQITFDVAGVYTVTLVVTYSGNEYMETKDNYIKVINISLVVDFEADMFQTYTGRTITFTDLINVLPESWEWTFIHESGAPELKSTDQNPQITFDVAGAYTVTLDVTHSGDKYTETKNDYITVFDIPSPGLIGHWLFDNETNLAKATVGLDLIPVGSDFTSVDGPMPTNKAVHVPQGSYFKCLPGISESTDVYTMMMHVKKTGAATYNCALAQMDPDNTDNAELLWGTGTPPGIDGIGNPTNHYCLPVNSWHQIVMVSNGDTKIIYIDGELAYTGTSNNARYLLDKAGLLFFTDSRSDWDNNMDVAEIAIWNLALTENEIHQVSGLQKLDKTAWTVPDHSSTGIATNLFDGLVTTNWNNSTEPPHYAVIDLGSQRNIGRIIVIGPNSAANMPKTIQLLTSVGDTPPAVGESGWTQVGEIVREVQSVNGMSGNFLTWNFAETSVTGRFLQMYLPDRWGTGLNIAEISVYEKLE